jgi:tetratricopeptide (TPR) repeat protein
MDAADGDNDAGEYDDLLDEAKELLDAGEHDDALRLYDEVSEQLAAATDSDLRTLAVFALYEKAFALKDLGRFDELLSTTALTLARYEDAPERDIQFYVAVALVLQAERLIKRHRYHRALRALDDALARSLELTDSKFRWIGACALAWKSKALAQSLRFRAMAKNNELLNEYLGPDPDPAVLDGVLHVIGTRRKMFLYQLRLWHGGPWLNSARRADSDIEDQ